MTHDVDTTSPFLRIPWTARLLSQPNILTAIPQSRTPKASTEDSLFAEVLKTSRTLLSCILFYRNSDLVGVEEVTALYFVGNGMNGHSGIIHGGITATLMDESMGMLQSVNLERERRGGNVGEEEEGLGSFTAYLNVQYKRPVSTPGAIAVVVKRVRKEGRKEWLSAELKQWSGSDSSRGDGDEEGELVVCATGEALFVTPRAVGSKL